MSEDERVSTLQAAIATGFQKLQSQLIPNALDEANAIAELATLSFQAQARFDEEHFFELILRRASGEPLSRLRGWQQFLGLKFQINSDVLVPRPETELLVEKGLEFLPVGGRILDLGTGSGAILITVLSNRIDATGWGIENFAPALEVAKANAKGHGVHERSEFSLGNWSVEHSKFDLVLCNPPYVADHEVGYLTRECREYDPPGSWAGGPDGLDAYRAVLDNVPKFLVEKGWVGLEIGWRTAEEISKLMVDVGLRDIRIYEALAGYSRAIFGQLQATDL